MPFALAPYLVCAGAFLLLSVAFGTRSAFGPMLEGLADQTATGIAAVSLVFSIQNLLWGLFQPLAGACADRFGATATAAVGALLYAGGLFIMWGADNWFTLHFGGAWMIGAAQSALGFPVLLGAVSRVAPQKQRALLVGVATAGASFGQLIFAQAAGVLITGAGVGLTLLTFTLIAALGAALALFLLPETRARRAEQKAKAKESGNGPTIKEAIALALATPGYLLIVTGFFVCGFQIGFMAVHLPNFAKSAGLGLSAGATALAVIGGFNILGTIAAGAIGGRATYARRPLASIYLLRTVVTAIFLLTPLSYTSFMLFAAVTGLLWLSTVPLTSEIILRQFGTAYAGTLFGIAFFSHQIGSFLGVAWAGHLFEATGDYTPTWYGSMLLGVIAFVMHIYINEGRHYRFS